VSCLFVGAFCLAAAGANFILLGGPVVNSILTRPPARHILKALEAVVPTHVGVNQTYRENAGGTSSCAPDAQRAGDMAKADGASPVFGAANPSPVPAAMSRPGSLPLPWGATSPRAWLLVGVWAEMVACAC